MVDEDGRVEREGAELLDEERRCVAAITAGYDCISADAAMIRAANPGAARARLIEALFNRMGAFHLLLVAFAPRAKVFAEVHGDSALQSRVDTLIAETVRSARGARINAIAERVFAELITDEDMNDPKLLKLERRLTDLEADAAALERDGNAGPRGRLAEVLRDVRAKMRPKSFYVGPPLPASLFSQPRVFPQTPATQQPAARQPAPQQRAPQQPAPQQPAARHSAEDLEEAAELRAIQRAIDADNRATSMKIFEIQRKAQQDAHESMQRIHDAQNKMKLDGGERT